MEIIKDIKEDRRRDDPQENPILVNLKEYLNNKKLLDKTWTGTSKVIVIDFIRRFTIYEREGEILYETRYDGTSALGKGKGITRPIPPEVMKPIERYFKLKNII